MSEEARLSRTRITTLFSPALEEASRWAALFHRNQTRKGTLLPYFQHPTAVAMILLQDHWTEDTVIAGFLHDLLEDTRATVTEIETSFGSKVASIVQECTEQKYSADGHLEAWHIRKKRHLKTLANALLESKAVTLADKVHNLISIKFDIDHGEDVWQRFRSNRVSQLGHYRAIFDELGTQNPRLSKLASCGLSLLDEIS